MNVREYKGRMMKGVRYFVRQKKVRKMCRQKRGRGMYATSKQWKVDAKRGSSWGEAKDEVERLEGGDAREALHRRTWCTRSDLRLGDRRKKS